MSVAINGSGTITGLTATGISAQPVFAGNVLQVVSATYATTVTSTSSSYSDTGLTASITPTSSSSKILVLINQAGCGKLAGDGGLSLKLVRGTTDVGVFSIGSGYDGDTGYNYIGSCSASFLDLPSSASSVAYKTQIARSFGSGSAVVQADSATSTLILMEIAG